MRKLGTLSAEFIEVGDLVEINGCVTKVNAIGSSVWGDVVLETELFEGVEYSTRTKLNIYSAY